VTVFAFQAKIPAVMRNSRSRREHSQTFLKFTVDSRKYASSYANASEDIPRSSKSGVEKHLNLPQIPLFPPLTKGDERGISWCEKLR
jgi:hypothetical protein